MASSEDRMPHTVAVASAALAAFTAAAVADVIASGFAVGRIGTAGREFLASVLAQEVLEPADVVAVLEQSLWRDLAVAAVAAVVFGILALAVRRPWRASRVLVWAAAVPLIFLLVCVVALGMEYAPPADIGMAVHTPADLGLVPGWHSTARSLLTTVEVVLLAVASIQLMRSESADFYRSQILGPSLGATAAARQSRLESETAGS
ncbi:hypothetical protein [Catellatospora sichuanensis]|uniref:hypothetical protein n=1 Tax=Catellatospora sichuanensis TaxID=1969805 RepID=UPI001183F448|nr:hypothetical protein [Catellatospora sichuanensis]